MRTAMHMQQGGAGGGVVKTGDAVLARGLTEPYEMAVVHR